jgi:hypothetical protein
MRKVAIGLCAMVVVVFTGWTAQAAPTIPPVTKYSPVESVGCSGPGRCPWGRHWVCGPYGRCGCVACGGVYRPYARPYVHPYVRPYPRRHYYY